MQDTLTDSRLAEVAALLAKADDDFARILTSHGPPPLWDRDPGFVTLLRIILEQQVSERILIFQQETFVQHPILIIALQAGWERAVFLGRCR